MFTFSIHCSWCTDYGKFSNCKQPYSLRKQSTSFHNSGRGQQQYIAFLTSNFSFKLPDRNAATALEVLLHSILHGRSDVNLSAADMNKLTM